MDGLIGLVYHCKRCAKTTVLNVYDGDSFIDINCCYNGRKIIVGLNNDRQIVLQLDSIKKICSECGREK